YAGTSNTGRTAVLEQGMTWKSLAIPAEDAQFIQSRAYQINEIARIFNLSRVFLHDLGRATWANLETLNRQLVEITLKPWLQKIESQIRRKLLLEKERSSYFAEHNVSGLIQPDTLTRYQAYDLALKDGWMLKSEVRAAERLDPIDGIDQPAQPKLVLPPR